MAGSIGELEEGFDRLVALMAERDRLVLDNLDKIGPQLREQLTDIIETSLRSDDWQTAAMAGMIQEDLLSARLYLAKFLLQNLPEQADRVEAEFGELDESLDRLTARLRGPTGVAAGDLREFGPLFTQYRDAFTALRGVIVERNAVRSAALDETGAAINSWASEMKNLAIASEDKFAEDANTIFRPAEIAIILAIAGALAIAALLSNLGARSITRPLSEVQTALGRVESGDYEAEVPHVERGNEVGALSRSVLALRDSLKERDKTVSAQTQIIDAIGSNQAIIEFDTSGRILKANEIFFKVMGYSPAETIGQHHSMLVSPEMRTSPEYREHWNRLGRGEQIAYAAMPRIAKGNRQVFLQGAYTPVRNAKGEIDRVVKVAGDVTEAETARLAAIADREAAEAAQAKVVKSLSDALTALAGGDLTERIGVPFASDYEALRANFNEAVDKLEGALSSVMAAAENIHNESIQVTQAADDLSHRTENQAAALEETAASLEELTASVKAAAAGAEKASVDVAATRRSAEESGRIVREAVDAMSEIEKSSQHISQIIGVIDDIAFQTNLLALNAGIEAARAASEVRALAQRSSDAAKDIKALISTSSQQVSRGVDLVGETGKSLQTIVESVTGITALIGDIANSSREQSVGLSEINTAVNQLDQVTQQNAAMVEESTAASHAMKAEAESLSGLVARFKADPARASAATGSTQVVRAPRTLPRAAEPRKGPKAPVRTTGAKPDAHTNGSAALALKRRDTAEEWQEF